MNAKAAGGMGGRLNHAPLVPASAHNQQFDLPELGVVVTADFDEEGVEIYMDESRGHAGAYTRRMAVALNARTTAVPARSPISSEEAVVIEAMRGRPTS